MYDLQLKTINLVNKLVLAQDILKQKLDSNNISYPSNDVYLRRLISLIPMRASSPIDLYQSLNGHTSVNISDNEVVFCGGSNNIQKLYNTSTNTFISKQNYPYTITEHGGAKWGNIIYYCGGTGTVSNKTYAYSIQSNTFTAKVNIPINVAYHTFVSTANYLLLSGGYYSGDLATQYTYDVASNTYSSKRAMLKATDHHSTAHIKNDQVLINGGNDSTNSIFNYIFDIATATITQKLNLTTARSHHKSLKINDNTILINGGNVTVANTTQSFNVNTNTFTGKKTSPRTWSNHTLSLKGSDFLISGGGDNKQHTYDYQRDVYLSS